MQAYRSSIYDYSRIIYRLISRRPGGMNVNFYILNKKPTTKKTFSLTMYRYKSISRNNASNMGMIFYLIMSVSSLTCTCICLFLISRCLLDCCIRMTGNSRRDEDAGAFRRRFSRVFRPRLT